ncbi:FkbM family methyltransferase [Mangrovimonas sp. YM274]|uniref:FkbM family methyltransferase n=1 Tax=Mangrovimonas sp. YM274 TaxID=3070660 RepID=UPI0027DE3716|nr:FkbM family methyltransferase [Mangrovimonas sp. YM274]WMI69670.1 FkbM family methyltransferase [Mangrovimonas sp. YM274]
MLKQLFYKIIYNKNINYVLRNLNLILHPVFKNVKIPPSGVLKLKTRSGNIKICTNQTSYITQLLFWQGYGKFEYSLIFEKLSKQISYFLDIGSNIGYYSLIASKANPEIKIYAFEPAKGPKHFLSKNILINNFENNIELVDLAISNTIGNIDFYEVENKKYTYLKQNLAGEGNAGTKISSRNFVKNSVKSSTLDEFITSTKVPQIDLIKIDTEGTEIDILNSGLEQIKKFEPIIICETLFNNIEDELDSFFKGIGYDAYNHTAEGLKKIDSIKREKDNGVRNCFFVPKSKIHLISPFIINN